MDNLKLKLRTDQQINSLAQQTAASLKQGKSLTIDLYTRALVIAFGDDWRNTWESQPDANTTVAELEAEIKALLLDYGNNDLDNVLINAYIKGARRHLPFDVPFKLGRGVNVQKLAEIKREYNKAIAEGEAPAKALAQAQRAVRGDLTSTNAVARAKKDRCFVVETPYKPGDPVQPYLDLVLSELGKYLGGVSLSRLTVVADQKAS